MPACDAMHSMILSMARQNKAGARTQPCRTPEVVAKVSETLLSASRTRESVPVCRSEMRFRMMDGVPMPRSDFHNASLSTESNAAFRSTYATYRGRSNSRWISDSSRRASIASIVDLPAVNPDCCGLRLASKSGFIRPSKHMCRDFARDGK